MAGVSELTTCNGKDGRVHVRLAPTMKTYCRRVKFVRDLRHWPIGNWELEDAKDEEYHCQACRERALIELEKIRKQEAKDMSGTQTYKWHPFANLYPMMPDAEIDSLGESIERIGQQEPVRLTHDGLVVDGRNRLVACRKRGIEPTVETLPELDDMELLQRVRAWNEDRRQLTPAQRAAAAAKADDLLKELRVKALERKAEAGKKSAPGKHSEKDVDPDPPLSDSGKTRDQVGKMFGVSGRSVDRARRVREASPEQFEAIERGKSIAAAERDAGLKPAKASKPKSKTKSEPETVVSEKLTVDSAVAKFKAFLAECKAGLESNDYATLIGKIGRHIKTTGDINAQVEMLYQAYPKKVGAGNAKKAIRGALRKRSYDELLEAIEAYAVATKGADKQYIPHPATWFNQERWNDDRSEWGRIGRDGQGGAANPQNKLRGVQEFLSERVA